MPKHDRLRVAVTCIVDPYGNNDGGRQRTQTIVRGLRDLGHEVTCYATSAPDQDPAPGVRYFGSGNLGSRGLMRRLGPLKRKLLPVATSMGASCPELSDALREDGPFDLFVATDLPCWRFAEASVASRRWIDFVDVTSEVASRFARSEPGPARLTAGAQAAWVRRREREVCAQAEIVTTAGLHDSQVLRAWAPHVRWVPPPAEISRIPLPMEDGAPARVAGFLGNLEFAPNLDAFDLLDTVWAPELTSAGWRVLVAGYGSERLRPRSQIEILGEVAEVEDFYSRVSCALAPLRLGGGIKVKAIEAMASGRPVIATPHVAEGFPLESQDQLVVVDPDRPNLRAVLERLEFDRELDGGLFSYRAFTESMAGLLG